MVYIFVFIFLLVLTFHFDIQGHINKKNKWERIAVLVLILLSALRNEVGGDTFVYEYQYNFYPSIFEMSKIGFSWEDLSQQPLWVLLNCFFKTISDSFFLLQCFISTSFNILLYNFFKSVSKKVFSCFLLFFCTQWIIYNFEILRESLSAVIYLTAIVDYIKKNNLGRYFLICLPAVFIHWFTVVMVLISPLFFVIRRKRTLPIVVLLSSAILIIGENVVLDAFNYASFYVEGDKFLSYLSDWNTREVNFFILVIQGLLLRMLYPALVVFHGKEEQEGRTTVILKRILIMYILIGALAIHVVIGYRLLHYLYPILIVLSIDFVSETFNRKNSHSLLYRKHVILNYTVIICMIIMVLNDVRNLKNPPANEYRAQIKYDCRYFPYTSVFEEKDKIRSDYYNTVSPAFYLKVYGE